MPTHVHMCMHQCVALVRCTPCALPGSCWAWIEHSMHTWCGIVVMGREAPEEQACSFLGTLGPYHLGLVPHAALVGAQAHTNGAAAAYAPRASATGTANVLMAGHASGKPAVLLAAYTATATLPSSRRSMVSTAGHNPTLTMETSTA